MTCLPILNEATFSLSRHRYLGMVMFTLMVQYILESYPSLSNTVDLFNLTDQSNSSYWEDFLWIVGECPHASIMALINTVL